MLTKNLTIMFTDIKGFTERTSGSSRQQTKTLLAVHEKLLVPVFQYFKGVIVKTIGDAFLVHFDSPTDAVLCGIAIQAVLRKHNQDATAEQMIEVRVAINVGEVDVLDGDVIGEAVNIAARLEGITEAGEVWFTDAVYQTMNRTEAPSAEVGERIFKGIPHPIKVYRVIQDDTELSESLSQAIAQAGKTSPSIDLSKPKPAFITTVFHTPATYGFILILAALVMIFVFPTQTELSMSKVARLLSAGEPLAALGVLQLELQENPGDLVLINAAVKSANLHLDKLSEEGDYQKAYIWLKKEMAQKNYLHTLSSRLAVLDAYVTTEHLIEEKNKYRGQLYPQPAQEFLSRNKQAEAAYAMAIALQGKWYPETRLWMFEQALERGHETTDEIFATATKALSTGAYFWPKFRKAEELLLSYYPKEGAEWAGHALQETNLMAYMNAWRLLDKLADERSKDGHYRRLYQLISAADIAKVKKIVASLRKETDKNKRQHAHAFVNELVETFPQYLNHGSIRDYLKQSLPELK
ncbi:MAG: adenylate/guanylate cyclase domain-containing protein [Gammaproteobacteria bacterium]|nr:adenylate/guanylate cyclase domain-containing protein [Gammaproteobacteria bacterium]